MADTAKLIKRLKARRAQLVRDLVTIEDRLDDEPTKDWEDRAVERQDDEVLDSLSQHDRQELRRIDAALARHASGVYGLCTICGNQIADARLEAVPETPFCVLCAE